MTKELLVLRLFALLMFIPLSGQAAINCRDLWKNGFPDPRIFNWLCEETLNETVGGTKVRIFRPSDSWISTDKTNQLMAEISEAARESISKLTQSFPSMTFIYMNRPSPTPERGGRGPTLLLGSDTMT